MENNGLIRITVGGDTAFVATETTTGSILGIIHFKFEFFKWCRMLSDIIMKTIGVIFLISDIFDTAK